MSLIRVLQLRLQVVVHSGIDKQHIFITDALSFHCKANKHYMSNSDNRILHVHVCVHVHVCTYTRTCSYMSVEVTHSEKIASVFTQKTLYNGKVVLYHVLIKYN